MKKERTVKTGASTYYAFPFTISLSLPNYKNEFSN
jgi:hypothetical protein